MRLRHLSAFLLFSASLFGATVNSISFNQVDFYHNGTLQLANSAWGEFIVNFTQDREGTSFLNVVRQTAAGSTWIVRNLPLPSTSITGTTALTIERDIDLGVANGSSVVNTAINFIYTVTTLPMSIAPISGTAGAGTIGSAAHQSNSGIGGGPNDILAPPQPQAAPAPGSSQSTSVWHKNMINVPQGTNQCLPGAMADSIQWLAGENKLNLNQTPPNTLSELAGDMGTSGATGTFETSAISGVAQYIAAHNLPIEVHYYGGGAGGSNQLPNTSGFTDSSGNVFFRDGDVTWEALLAEMQKDQNVVALLAHHAIVIEGLTDTVDENGEHHRTVNYREDPMQGSGPAGERLDVLAQSRSAEWTDPNPGLGTRALLDNDTVFTLLVESPVQPPPGPISIPITGEFASLPLIEAGFCTSIAPVVNAIINLPSFPIVQMANGNVVVSNPTNPNLFATGQFNPSTGIFTASGSAVQQGQTVPLQITMQSLGAVDNGPPSYSGSFIFTNGNNSCTVTFVAVPLAQQLPAALTSPALAGDPISMLSGEMIAEPRADLSLGGPLPLEFRRYYGSLLALNGINGSLGTNWLSNFDVRAFVSGANASVVTFRGAIIRFTGAGSSWRLLSPYPFGYQFQVGGNGFQFMDPSSKLIYSFGSDGRLTSIADRNGNTMTLVQGPNGPTIIADNLGRGFSLTYDSNGHVTKVQDQTGRSVAYAYNGSSLASFTDANGKITTYTSAPAGAIASALTRTTLPAGNTQYAQTYDSLGRALSQTDGDGNTANVAYGQGAIGDTSVTDARGNTWTQSHPNLFDFTSSIDPTGNVTVTNYDANGRPVALVDRNGNRTTVTYHNPSGYLASITDGEGNTTSFSYGATNSSSTPGFTFYDLLSIQNPDGTSIALLHDFNGNLVKRVDASGNATTFTPDPRGLIKTIVNPAGGTTTFTYNAAGMPATRQTPAGDTTTYNYDALNRLTQVRFADGSSRNFTYDALDRVTATVDERSKRTAFNYTDNSKLASVIDATGNLNSVQYDGAENPAAFNTPAGAFSATYNGANLPASNRAPTGEVSSFTYDKLNRLAMAADSVGTLATFGYDNEKSIASITDGANRSTIFTRDHVGQPFLTITPLTEFWQTSFTSRGRLASILDPLGQTTAFTYDANNRLTKFTLPGGIAASYLHDTLGNLTSVTDPNGGQWTRLYDSSGRLSARTDPQGRSTQFTYDHRDRIATVSNQGGRVQYTYDAAGNLTHAAYPDGSSADYTFDDDERLTGGSGFSITYDGSGRIATSNGLAITRDASGRITGVQYPPGAVSYAYNSRGLVSKITDWTGASSSLAYDASLRIAAIARANGVNTAFSYDGDGNLAGVTETQGSSTISTIAITRDADGRVLTSNRATPQAPAPANGSQAYSYDSTHGISGATYDAAGRLTKDALRTYTWDFAGHLLSYSGADGAASFTYDALGGRITRTAQGTTQNFSINYALPLPSPAIVKSGGTDQTYYLYLPDGTLFAAIDAATGAHHYYHFDESGNTVFLSGDNGAVTDSYGITPYGESVVQSGSTANPFTWQGKFGVMQEGATSLYYLRARYYDSAPAHFLSRDPVDNPAPRTADPYQYATADPVDVNDPAGLAPGQITTPTNMPAFNLPALSVPDPSLLRVFAGPGAMSGPQPLHTMLSADGVTVTLAPNYSSAAPAMIYFPVNARLGLDNDNSLPIPPFANGAAAVVTQPVPVLPLLPGLAPPLFAGESGAQFNFRF